jgi:hypothetical protein
MRDHLTLRNVELEVAALCSECALQKVAARGSLIRGSTLNGLCEKKDAANDGT